MAGRCRSGCASYSPVMTGSACPRRVPIAGLCPGWPPGMGMPPARPGRRCWPVWGPPPWLGRRAGTAVTVPEQITAAVGELARAQHTTVNIVLQAAYATLLCALTGHHD